MKNQVFIECEECEGTGLNLYYVNNIKNLVHREVIPACEFCEGWGEIENKENDNENKESGG